MPRRSQRSVSHSPGHLRWSVPVFQGGITPMEKLMTWLDEHGSEYRRTRHKSKMLRQLQEEMETQGIYGSTVCSLSAQILRLKKAVKVKAGGGVTAVQDAITNYDRLLFLLFDEDERKQMQNSALKDHPSTQRVTRQSHGVVERAGLKEHSPHEAGTTIADDEEFQSDSRQPSIEQKVSVDPALDVSEIRRRFELLAARRELGHQGVAQHEIDMLLPLPKH